MASGTRLQDGWLRPCLHLRRLVMANTHFFESREEAVILAALRCYAEALEGGHKFAGMVEDVATDMGEHDPPTAKYCDEIAERYFL